MNAGRKSLLFTLGAFVALAALAAAMAATLAPPAAARKAAALAAVLGGAAPEPPFTTLPPGGRVKSAYAAGKGAYLLELRSQAGSGVSLALAALYAGSGELRAFGFLSPDEWTAPLSDDAFFAALKGSTAKALPRSRASLPSKLKDATSGATASADAALALLAEGAAFAAARGRGE